MSDIQATQIIILGGSGDLSQRKLLPALFDLYMRDILPQDFHIIGIARTPRSNEEYQTFVKQSLSKHVVPKEGKHHSLKDFCNRISYVTGSFDDARSYDTLKHTLTSFDEQREQPSNRLFYLAVPPSYYGQIFKDLKESGAADEPRDCWTHILVEKPFGNDLTTAQNLDTQLADLYREDQIFRIDHYLAKEAVQNILSFRFANTLLQATWNKKSVASVTVTMTETIDVGDRTNFYEGLGALRDVGQNHLLQLIALVAMREPAEFTSDTIRAARTEALEALRPIDKERLATQVLRAQYDQYKVCDPEAGDCSDTETYFELKAELDLPEWEGVPFYIRSGKALDQAEVSVTLTFKDVATGMFETDTCHSIGNQVKLTISPEQTIAVTLNAKSPGLGFQLEPRELSFVCEKGDSEIKNSYEKVLHDALIGDQTLFTKTEEVLAAWQFITPILEQWHELPLHTYEKGSRGPEASIIPEQ